MIYSDISTYDLEKLFINNKGDQFYSAIKQLFDTFIVIDKQVGKTKKEFVFMIYDSDEARVYTTLAKLKNLDQKININLEWVDEDKYKIEVKDY